MFESVKLAMCLGTSQWRPRPPDDIFMGNGGLPIMNQSLVLSG